MCMLSLLVVQYVIIFLDSNKISFWICLCHFIQILVNVLFGIIYGKTGTEELGIYTFDTLKCWYFWLALLCSCHMTLILVYIEKYVLYLFSDDLINNIRNGNYQNDLLRKKLIKKIEQMNKYQRNLEKFKEILENYNTFECKNFRDRKMKEVVTAYLKSNENINTQISDGNQPKTKNQGVSLNMKDAGQEVRNNNNDINIIPNSVSVYSFNNKA